MAATFFVSVVPVVVVVATVIVLTVLAFLDGVGLALVTVLAVLG
jgi:hypothetical protein